MNSLLGVQEPTIDTTIPDISTKPDLDLAQSKEYADLADEFNLGDKVMIPVWNTKSQVDLINNELLAEGNEDLRTSLENIQADTPFVIDTGNGYIINDEGRVFSSDSPFVENKAIITLDEYGDLIHGDTSIIDKIKLESEDKGRYKRLARGFIGDRGGE